MHDFFLLDNGQWDLELSYVLLSDRFLSTIMIRFVVIGAGEHFLDFCWGPPTDLQHVIGAIILIIAIKIQELGDKVTILAEHTPGDNKAIDYASAWAVRDLFAPRKLHGPRQSKGLGSPLSYPSVLSGQFRAV